MKILDSARAETFLNLFLVTHSSALSGSHLIMNCSPQLEPSNCIMPFFIDSDKAIASLFTTVRHTNLPGICLGQS
ncbi:hypothetical protein BJX66DRAFT_254711 [Aspergillus keveii]|uniref:Uncharacterized protein n=1 Tax=Aspergillus keveii TaxID=714993 RepID=A0ABR4FYS5_9EURO